MEQTNIEDMTVEKLRKELEFAKECLVDEEETFSFSLQKTSIHIGSKQAEAMKQDFEDKCRKYKSKIRKIEELLKEKICSI
jgi:hypothetical protein